MCAMKMCYEKYITNGCYKYVTNICASMLGNMSRTYALKYVYGFIQNDPIITKLCVNVRMWLIVVDWGEQQST